MLPSIHTGMGDIQDTLLNGKNKLQFGIHILRTCF